MDDYKNVRDDSQTCLSNSYLLSKMVNIVLQVFYGIKNYFEVADYRQCIRRMYQVKIHNFCVNNKGYSLYRASHYF